MSKEYQMRLYILLTTQIVIIMSIFVQIAINNNFNRRFEMYEQNLQELNNKCDMRFENYY